MGWQFSVTAIVEDLRLGEPPGRVLTYRVVFLDEETEQRLFASHAYDALIARGRARFTGEIEDVPVSLAWQPHPGRTHYAMLSPALCKQLALKVGSEVGIRFDLAKPDEVAVPEDVARWLAANTQRTKRWTALSAGTQRALLAPIASAKTAATRTKRIAGMFETLAKLRARRA